MNRPVTIKKIREAKTPPVIVVSAKVSKKATERNKIKRRIREIIKKHPQEVRGYKIFTNPSIKNLSFQELEEEIKNQLN